MSALNAREQPEGAEDLHSIQPLWDEAPYCRHPLITCRHCHRSSPKPYSRSAFIPFRNLKRSLSVERTRVVFSPMMDL